VAIYFPYLRAKQAELIAVERSRTVLATNGRILPVLEPVRVNTGPLTKRARVFGAAGLSVSLVMNPQVGELYGNAPAITALLAGMRSAGATVVPALIVHNQLQLGEVQTFQTGIFQGLSIYVHVGVPAAPVLAAIPKIAPAINLFHEGRTSAGHQNPFVSRALLRDAFRSQVRNANYPAQSFFSDLHLTYAGNGYVGFGDFATLDSEFNEGGGPPYAIAIHMTEDFQAQGTYCNHFLSTSNATQANPGGKFGEAVAALDAHVRANPGKLDFSVACQELLRHHTNGHFPGLAENKRLSIQHHLELMARTV
jgi:hypothetical protein